MHGSEDPTPESIVDLQETLSRAGALLAKTPVSESTSGQLWQAVVSVAQFVPSYPEETWDFASRWGRHRAEDIRSAIASCLLEHLLELHFQLIFPRIERAVREDKLFADTFLRCWKLGQSRRADNEARFDSLARECRRVEARGAS